jgi:hypothetical protein
MNNVIVIDSSDESDDSPSVTTEEILITRVVTVSKRTTDKAFGRDELRPLLQSPSAKRRLYHGAAPQDNGSSIIVPSRSIGRELRCVALGGIGTVLFQIGLLYWTKSAASSF